MNKPKPHVSIIIVNYQGRDDTLECLASLQHLTYPNYRVFVVDQASGDETPEAVRREFPTTVVIENPVNDGFAGGNNKGMEAALRAGTDYVFLLNNDTTVAPNLLEPLVSLAESDDKIGIVGPLMLYHAEPRIIWSAGAEVRELGQSVLWQEGEPVENAPKQTRDCGFIVGCGMLIKRTVLEEIGLFDDSYFLYYEESDFCAKARLAGWRIKLQPESQLWHKVSRSTGTESELTLYYMRRNVLRYLARYSRHPWYNVPRNFLDSLYLAGVWLVRGRGRRSKVVLMALRDALFRRYGKADIAFRR